MPASPRFVSPPRESADRSFNPLLRSFFFLSSPKSELLFLTKLKRSCNIYVRNIIKLVTGRSRNFKNILEKFKSHPYSRMIKGDLFLSL